MIAVTVRICLGSCGCDTTPETFFFGACMDGNRFTKETPTLGSAKVQYSRFPFADFCTGREISETYDITPDKSEFPRVSVCAAEASEEAPSLCRWTDSCICICFPFHHPTRTHQQPVTPGPLNHIFSSMTPSTVSRSIPCPSPPYDTHILPQISKTCTFFPMCARAVDILIYGTDCLDFCEPCYTLVGLSSSELSHPRRTPSPSSLSLTAAAKFHLLWTCPPLPSAFCSPGHRLYQLGPWARFR